MGHTQPKIDVIDKMVIDLWRMTFYHRHVQIRLGFLEVENRLEFLTSHDAWEQLKYEDYVMGDPVDIELEVTGQPTKKGKALQKNTLQFEIRFVHIFAYYHILRASMPIVFADSK